MTFKLNLERSQETLKNHLFWFYWVNVVVIALPLAIFEIWLERFKTGWGGEFKSRFWGRKIEIRWLNKIFGFLAISVYHLVMFGLVLPAIYLSEYLVLAHLAGSHSWVISFNGYTLVPLIYFVGLWIGVSVMEDFLYFLLNWHFPNALRRLFRGEATWLAYWDTESKIQIPNNYICGPLVICILFGLQKIIIKYSHSF